MLDNVISKSNNIKVPGFPGAFFFVEKEVIFFLSFYISSLKGGDSLLSPSLEDYLEEICRISQRGEAVRVTDIAACLKVSLPSVTRAMQRLDESNYIKYRRYKEIILTDKGKEFGQFLVERNRIIRDFLKLIGSECDAAAEAEAMEHYLSLPTLLAIMNFVKFSEKHSFWLDEYKQFCLANKERPGLTPGHTIIPKPET